MSDDIKSEDLSQNHVKKSPDAEEGGEGEVEEGTGSINGEQDEISPSGQGQGADVGPENSQAAEGDVEDTENLNSEEINAEEEERVDEEIENKNHQEPEDAQDTENKEEEQDQEDQEQDQEPEQDQGQELEEEQEQNQEQNQDESEAIEDDNLVKEINQEEKSEIVSNQETVEIISTEKEEEKNLLDEEVEATSDPRRHVHVEGTNVSSSHEGEVDVEGYRIDQHQETEHFSHTREIKDVDDHLEIVQQDTRCLQLEEVKTKETVRPATAEELKALLGASIFDGKDEIEIGTEIVVEGFTRVEHTHEETDSGGVTSKTVTVTETREKEELHEDPNQPPQLPIEGNAPTNEEYQIQLEHVTGDSVPALTHHEGKDSIEVVESVDKTVIKLNHAEPDWKKLEQPDDGKTKEQDGKIDAPKEVEKEKTEEEKQLNNNEVNETNEAKEEILNNKPAEEKQEKKSKGIVGYIKERSRSLSRSRTESINKDDAGVEKTKKKKKFSFLSKSESKKGLNRQSRADETDGKPPTGKKEEENTGSADDLGDEKKENKSPRKLSFFAKQKEGGGGDKSKSSTLERDPSSGGKEPRSRSWSLFRRKSDSKKGSPEKKKIIETSKSEHTTINDTARQNSNNSLQKGSKNVIQVDDVETCAVQKTVSSDPRSLQPGKEQNRRASVNSVTTPAAVAGYSAVVAVDLGATVSSYAFSFTHENPDVIHTMRKPEGSDPGICDPKFPSVILLNPEGEFHSFGFNARNVYQSLEPSEAEKWMYFDSFRKQLTQIEDVRDDPVVKASNGLSVPGAVLLEHALKFLSFEALQDIDQQTGGTPVGKIRWVITAPAGWHTEARHWIRHVAYKIPNSRIERVKPEINCCPGSAWLPDATVEQCNINLFNEASLLLISRPFPGNMLIKSKNALKIKQINLPTNSLNVGLAAAEFPQQLLVMQEPQAAAVCVHQLQLREWQENYEQDVQLLKKQQEREKEGTQLKEEDYIPPPIKRTSCVSMIVNCGGDELTVSVYDITETSMSLMYQQISTNSGGAGVNDAFIKLLTQLFGSDFIEDYKSKKPSGWADLIVAFESGKRSLDPVKDNSLNVPLPFSFIDHHQRHFGYEVEVSLEKNKGSMDVAWTQQGMLRLYPEAWRALFQPLIDKILLAVRQACGNPSVKDLGYLWLIGGFSECQLLQKTIREAFCTLFKTIVPKETSHVAVKGAVSFGVDPVRIIFNHSSATNNSR